MARRKVKLAFIEHYTTRRVTFTKRVKSLMKKTEELGALCGIDICTIVYGPDDDVPTMWPSCDAEARRIIRAFKRKPEVDQSERQLDQETFLKQCVSKAQEKFMKLQRRDRDMEMENLISDVFSGKFTLDQIPHSDLEDMVCAIDDKLRIIQHKISVAHPSLVINPTDNDAANTSISDNNQGLNAVVGQTSLTDEMKDK